MFGLVLQEASFGGGSRNGHLSNRNGNNHNLPQPMEREQQQQQYGVGGRGHVTMSATVTDYRMSQPNFPHPGTLVQQPSASPSYLSTQAPVTSHPPHMHTAQPHSTQLPHQPMLGPPRGDNIHSHVPPQRTPPVRPEGHRYHPYPVRR